MANSARLGLTASLCQDLRPGGWLCLAVPQPTTSSGWKSLTFEAGIANMCRFPPHVQVYVY